MYALQCRLPGEASWTDIYYDATSPTEEDARKRLTDKKKFIVDSGLLAPETEFRVIGSV